MKKNVIMVSLIAIALFACSKTESGTTIAEAGNNSGAKIVVSPSASAPEPQVAVEIPLAISTKLSGFDSARPNQILDIPVLITNKTETAYNDPTNISYHWFDVNGKEIVHDGERTALKLPLAASAESDVTIRISAPKNPGAYVVQVDLVKEGQYWFADKGMAPIRLPVEVK